MKTDILRKKFLDFFKSKKHKIVSSASLVPHNDPTVLFTSAGMSQFKEEFLGRVTNFRRATSCQKCLRTDDLTKVGKTPSHHTFFEMLGNFSFGDYFKKEAISWAWEFLTEELNLDKEKLWVSVYLEDQEAYNIWKDIIKVPQEKIVKLGASDNFWPQDAIKNGPNGPCGPCSEIFYDWGKELGCGDNCKPGCNCNKSGKRFVEVWNLVFTQFNRGEGGVLNPLPNKNIDTGMGLERIASVMQGKFTNFEIDIFEPLIKEIARKTEGIKYSEQKEVFNMIADHARAIVFAISDGVMPSNEDKGYVIRKLIRKSILDAKKLNIYKPFLYKLVSIVALVMKQAYPELEKRKEDVAQIVQHEEKNFYHTLNNSSKMLEESFRGVTQKEQTGAIAFNLYDTFGIPKEITKDWLDKKGIGLDENGFMYFLNEQKERSKKKGKFGGEIFTDKKILNINPTKFLGYNNHSLSGAKILGILKDGVLVDNIKEGQAAEIILDKTCFYPDSGGQLGDQGTISAKNSKFKVLDTKKAQDLILHIGELEKGSLKRNTLVSLDIDFELRNARSRAHTATHILQAVLREVIGQHIRQAGSLVDADYLRFDFTHFKALSLEEISRIEELVNDKILESKESETKSLSLAQAQKLGALAFFEEKYGEKVRMVCMGDYSKELCGGTHLENTAGIGSFKIISEGSSAKGVRRIEAVTGKKSLEVQNKKEKELLQAISDLNLKIKSLELDRKSYEYKSYEANIAAYINEAILIGLSKLIIKKLGDLDVEILRRLTDTARRNIASGAVIFVSNKADGLFLVIALTKDLVEKGLSAVGLIKEVSGLIGGSGGGRDDFAQAGGKETNNIDLALEKITQSIKQKLEE